MNIDINFFLNDTKKLAPIIITNLLGNVYKCAHNKSGQCVVDIVSSYIEYPYHIKKDRIDRENEVFYHEIAVYNEYSYDKYGYDNVEFKVD